MMKIITRPPERTEGSGASCRTPPCCGPRGPGGEGHGRADDPIVPYADLDVPAAQRAGDIVLIDSTHFITLFGGTDSLRNLWHNLATMK